jgi:hypothetical protein
MNLQIIISSIMILIFRTSQLARALPATTIIKYAFRVSSSASIAIRLRQETYLYALSPSSQKLYDDMQAAWNRRSEEERILLGEATELMEAKTISAVSGSGFGAQAVSGQASKDQVKEMATNGVLRINGCITKSTAAALRAYILKELDGANADVISGRSDSKSRFGLEMERHCRADVLLSMMAPKDTSSGHPHPVAAALNELLGEKGKLVGLFEALVGKK